MKSARGFTLIEVLLAISLLGILLVLIGSAMIGANRTLARSEQFSSRLEEIRAAQVFLRRELQQVLPLRLNGGQHGMPDVFSGNSDEIRYIASLPTHLGGGLYLQTLRIEGTDKERWLQVDFARIAGGTATQAWGQPQRLLRHVGALHFSYTGLDQKGRPTGWLPRWPWPERLPQRVRVDLDSQGPVAWPSLDVALRLDVESLDTAGSSP